MTPNECVFYLKKKGIDITVHNFRYKVRIGQISSNLTAVNLDLAIDKGVFNKKNRPKITPEKQQEVVNYYLSNSNNTIKQIAEHFDLVISTVNHCIDLYFKTKSIGFEK